MRGYEADALAGGVVHARLRIPMRGYEACDFLQELHQPHVTNPHAGL